MNYPVFAHYERDTFDHAACGWESAKGRETPEQTTDRLVLHAMRCGKRAVIAISYHAGFAHQRGPVMKSLRRLEKAGRVRKTSEGWEAV